MEFLYQGIQFSVLERISGKITIDSHESSAAIPVGSSLEFLEQKGEEFFFRVTQPNKLAYKVSLTRQQFFALVRTRKAAILPQEKISFSLVFSHTENRYFFEDEWARITFDQEGIIGIIYQDGGFCDQVLRSTWDSILSLVLKKEIEIY